MAAILESNKSNAQCVKEIYDLRSLFQQLRDNGIKIAICTSDSRYIFHFFQLFKVNYQTERSFAKTGETFTHIYWIQLEPLNQ